MLGVITASPLEAKSLKFAQGISCEVSGPGEYNALSAATYLIEKGATALLSWGVAGSLDPTIPPGSIILPKLILKRNAPPLSVSKAWHWDFYKLLLKQFRPNTQSLLHSARVIATADEKSELFNAYQAAAVDMESYVIVEAANQVGIPCLVLRSIIDPADMDLPEVALSALDDNGNLNIGRVISSLLYKPWQLPALWQLSNYFKTANESLRFVSSLAAHKKMGLKNFE